MDEASSIAMMLADLKIQLQDRRRIHILPEFEKLQATFERERQNSPGVADEES